MTRTRMMMVSSLVAIQCLSRPRRRCRINTLQVLEIRSQQCSSQPKEAIADIEFRCHVVCRIQAAAKLDRLAVARSAPLARYQYQDRLSS